MQGTVWGLERLCESMRLNLTQKPKQKLGLLLLFLFLPNLALAHIEPWMQYGQLERELAENPDDLPLLIDKAHYLIQMGRLDEADVTLQRVEELEPTRSADATYTNILLLQSRGEIEKAFGMSDWGIKQFPDDYYQWNIRAMLSVKAEKYSLAIEALNKCVSIDGEKDPYNYIVITKLLLKRNDKGDKEKALALLNKRISNITNKYEAGQLLQLTISINTYLKRYEEALKNIKRLEKQHGEQIPYTVKRAEILKLAGRYKEAIDAYDSAISILDELPKNRRNKRTDEMKALYMKNKASLQTKHAKSNP